MGGEVFVGIRDREGREHLSLRHTNPMAWVMASPEFYTNEGYLREIIDRAKPGQSWPKSVPTDRIQPSEYGVILVDFPTKSVLSRQDYCAVGGRHVMGDPHEDDAKLLLSIRDLGWVTGVLRYGDHGTSKLPDDEAKPIWSVLEVAASGQERRCDPLFREDWYDVLFCPTGWNIAATIDRAIYVWPEVVAWLKEHGWTSPFDETLKVYP